MLLFSLLRPLKHVALLSVKECPTKCKLWYEVWFQPPNTYTNEKGVRVLWARSHIPE